jgi:hypothetical protein
MISMPAPSDGQPQGFPLITALMRRRTTAAPGFARAPVHPGTYQVSGTVSLTLLLLVKDVYTTCQKRFLPTFPPVESAAASHGRTDGRSISALRYEFEP